MARKGGQIVARGASTWLVRVYLWARSADSHVLPSIQDEAATKVELVTGGLK